MSGDDARRARRRRYLVRALLVLGTAAFLIVIGVSPIFAIPSAALVFAATIAWSGLPLDSSATLRVRREARPGTRSDLARLATDLRGADPRSAATVRVRELARRRLARIDGRGRGSPMLALVEEPGRRIATASVPGILDALDRLEDHGGRRAS